VNERNQWADRLRGLPVAPQRAERIDAVRQRARRRFVELGRRQLQTPPGVGWSRLVEPALLALIAVAYLSWTAVTVVGLERTPDRIVPATWPGTERRSQPD
jgi:hypothetical protein